MKKNKELITALVPKTDQPHSIPKNWVWTTITALADQRRGVNYSKSDASSQPSKNSILILRGGNIQDGEFQTAEDCVFVPNGYVSEARKCYKWEMLSSLLPQAANL